MMKETNQFSKEEKGYVPNSFAVLDSRLNGASTADGWGKKATKRMSKKLGSFLGYWGKSGFDTFRRKSQERGIGHKALAVSAGLIDWHNWENGINSVHKDVIRMLWPVSVLLSLGIIIPEKIAGGVKDVGRKMFDIVSYTFTGKPKSAAQQQAPQQETAAKT